jgi:ATP-dependent helicase/nuclease subunit A
MLDFKTGLSVPAAAEAVPVAYLRQMAAYRAVLSHAFPGRAVRAGLLYTGGPRLLWLGDELLDAALPA